MGLVGCRFEQYYHNMKQNMTLFIC